MLASTMFAGAAKSLPGSAGAGSVFEQKIEQASAKMYFHYYGQLVHQQNMLQDYVRTGTSCSCCSKSDPQV